MNDLRTAAQQALEAMEKATRFMSDSDYRKLNESIDALKAALAEPVQEPDSPERRCGGPGCDGTCCQPVGEPVQQALVEADRIMGHNDEATEWRERWAHLFGVAGIPVQEPVVWMSKADIENPSGWRTVFLHTSAMATENSVPLYTAPPQRKPQGCEHCNHPLYAAIKCRVCGRVTEPQRKPLSEEEIRNMWEGHIVPVFGRNGINPIVFARVLERAHGIKE